MKIKIKIIFWKNFTTFGNSKLFSTCLLLLVPLPPKYFTLTPTIPNFWPLTPFFVTYIYRKMSKNTLNAFPITVNACPTHHIDLYSPKNLRSCQVGVGGWEVCVWGDRWVGNICDHKNRSNEHILNLTTLRVIRIITIPINLIFYFN